MARRNTPPKFPKNRVSLGAAAAGLCAVALIAIAAC
jgi:hypothetical protein